MYSEISSIQDIENDVKFDSNGFSQTKFLGEFINNQEYSTGFINFMANRQTADAYMWKCLSAIGEQLGEVVYTNVRRYVDFVSNVDVCKVQSLRSMMKMLGFDYTVFDDIEKLPVEVLNLMNIVSISKKYLMSNGMIGENLKDDVLRFAGSGGLSYDEEELLKYYDRDRILSDEVVIDSRSIDDMQYFNYIRHLYETLLSGFLTLEFNIDPDHTLSGHYYIYPTLSSSEGFDAVRDASIMAFKRSANIDAQYDEREQADMIENHEAELSDYDYPYNELIQMEIDRRQARATSADVFYGQPLTREEKQRLAANTSKYTYYRVKKVYEYIEFVNNKYFLDNIANLSSVIYKLDPDFINIKQFKLGSSSDDIQYMNVVQGSELDSNMIKQVARSLATATMYIIKLREKLKLQSRKNYMKGTQNLLLYIINEYLVDYSRHHLYLSSGVMVQNPYIMRIMQELSSHSIDKLRVLEYYDETEYYNQETGTSKFAENSNQVFDDFWKQYNLTADDGLTYRLDEIQRFYLSSMQMKNVLSSEDELADFLDAVFTTGANDSFISKQNGLFSTRLSAFGHRQSDEIWPMLNSLSTAYIGFSTYLDEGFKYPVMPIESQLTNVLNENIFPRLSSEYFRDISSMYNIYHSDVVQLSARLDDLAAEYQKLAFEDNQFYLTSSDVEYCLLEHDDGTKVYKHDFYIDNPVYMQGVQYLSEKLSRFKDFIYSIGVDVENAGYNIQNHQLIDMTQTLTQRINGISSDYENQVVDQILNSIGDSSFVDIQAPYMGDELQQGYDYLAKRKDSRLEYLNKMLDEIRNQASSFQQRYEALESTVASIIAQYDDQSACYQLGQTSILYFSQGKESGGGWKRATTPSTKGIRFYYVKEVGMYYYQTEKGKGDYEAETYSISHPYSSSDTLLNRINAVIEYMNAPTSYSENGDKYYGLQNAGILASLEACKTTYTELEGELKTIANRISYLGGTYKYSDYSDLTLKEQISKLVDFLTSFDEKTFENDEILSKSASLLKVVTQLSAEFSQVKLAYQDFLKIKSQREYLTDFTQGNQLTVQELNRMLKYAETTDEKNKKKIIAQYEDMYNRLYDLQQDVFQLSQNLLAEIAGRDQYTGIVELDVMNLDEMLLADIENRFVDQSIRLDATKQKIYGYVDVMSSQISSKLQELTDFGTTIRERLSSLYFLDDPQYIDQKEMFQQYTGLSDVSRYPYYTYSNITHPSYQIHPFLWNFVLRDKYDLNTITKSFYSITVDELENANIQSNIDRYYGEFGNSVSAWLRNTFDYSGYTTRYEDSQHYSIRSSAKSEVVGYDGTFYPPAVSMLAEDYERCVESLRECADLESLSAGFVKSNPSIVDLLDLEIAVDSYGNDIGRKCVGYTRLVDAFAANFGIAVNNLNLIEGVVSAYISENTDENGILSKTINIRDLSRRISMSSPETFYGRFYRHLGIEKDSEYHQFLVGQLEEYYPEISAITKTMTSEKDVYDVYKYCVDGNDNIYFLLKQYEDEEPTYKQKRDTPGRLWMRPCEMPLAFPAFTGEHPCIQTTPRSKLHIWVAELAKQNDGLPIKNEMRCFYDMYIAQNNNNLYLVSQIGSDGFDRNNGFVQNFENPWILNFTTSQQNPNTKQLIIRLADGIGDTQDNAINSGLNIYQDPAFNSVPAISVDNYAFIGAFYPSVNQVSFVYARKRYNADQTVQLLGDVRIIPVENGQVKLQRILSFSLDVSDTASDDIVFSYDADQVLTFAYLVKNEQHVAVNNKVSDGVDVPVNTSGPVFEDPRTNEMTSHDVFTNHVRFVKYRLVSTQTVREVMNSKTDSNTNADMSYIPVYPGLSGEADLRGFKDEYLRVELLGFSNNIDRSIAAVNISADPYFDYGRLSSDSVFGRVYEDYDKTYSRSLRVFQNRSINNSSREDVEIEDGSFIWTVSGFSDTGYTDAEIRRMKLAVYNTGTLGKNPYLIDDLSVFSDGEWHELSGYETTYSEERFAETVLSGIPNLSDRSFVNVTGTYSGEDRENFTDCNHIENICMMSIRYDSNLKKLQFKFDVEDISRIDETFVKDGVIRVIAYNVNDLRIFNHYHFMDVYGAVNMRDTTIDIPADRIRDDVSFIYDKNAYAVYNMSQNIRSYYDLKNGIREYTDEIDLSAYDFLSDVYILQTSKRLNFMYDEELEFKFGSNNYYFPTFNTAYPKTPGQGFDSSVGSMFCVNALKGMFGEGNIFILDLLNQKYIADSIGSTDIPIQVDETECYRIFEQETEFDDGESVSAYYGKYDSEDSRSMQYMHIFEEDGSMHKDVSEIEQIVERNPLTYDAAEQLVPYGVIKTSQEESNYDIQEKIRFSVDSDSADFSDLLKLYVNYKKDADGIHLYFNYFNYLNTPFVKIVDNKIYPEIMPETYLHLAPDESGSISFISQFKFIMDGGIYGCRNIELAKYSVYNVSDDKPKFLLKLQRTVQPGDGSSAYGASSVSLYAGSAVVDTSKYDDEDYPELTVRVNIVSVGGIQPGYKIGVNFMPQLFAFLPEQKLANGISADGSQRDSGYVEFTVTEEYVSEFKFKLHSVKNARELKSYTGKYQIGLELPDLITSANGLAAKTELHDGILTIA